MIPCSYGQEYTTRRPDFYLPNDALANRDEMHGTHTKDDVDYLHYGIKQASQLEHQQKVDEIFHVVNNYARTCNRSKRDAWGILYNYLYKYFGFRVRKNGKRVVYGGKSELQYCIENHQLDALYAVAKYHMDVNLVMHN